MKFVILGDAHLWPALWSRVPAARYDSYSAAGQVFNYAREQQLPVLCSGDLLNCGERGGVADVMSFLSDALSEITFGYIVGNHDLSGYTSGISNPPWMYILKGYTGNHLAEKVISPGEGLKVFGIDYQHGRQRFLEKLNAIPEPVDILVIHQGMREWLSFQGAWECQFDDFKGKAKLVICGHTHIREFVEQGDVSFLSPGSTVPWRLDEDSTKQFPVLDFDKKITVEWVNIRGRQVLDKTVLNLEEAEKLILEIDGSKPDETLPTGLRSPILKLRYMPDEGYYSRIVRICEDRGWLLLADPIRTSHGQINLGALTKPAADADEIEVATHKHTSPGRIREASVEIQRSKDPEGVIERHLQEIAKGV